MLKLAITVIILFFVVGIGFEIREYRRLEAMAKDVASRKGQ